MIKPYFTRKNFIKLALSFFYSITVLFSGFCIDGGKLDAGQQPGTRHPGQHCRWHGLRRSAPVSDPSGQDPR